MLLIEKHSILRQNYNYYLYKPRISKSEATIRKIKKEIGTKRELIATILTPISLNDIDFIIISRMVNLLKTNAERDRIPFV